jgi:hypothetical protein
MQTVGLDDDSEVADGWDKAGTTALDLTGRINHGDETQVNGWG